MNNDLLTQLRTYGQHIESKMAPLEVDHVGDPVIVLTSPPPKPSRRRILALTAAATVLLIMVPILVMRDRRSISSVPAVAIVLHPDGGSSGAQLRLIVPDGWSTFGDWAVNNGAELNWMGVAFGSVGNIHIDRCQWRGALLDPPLGPTVDDLAGALAEYWGSDATPPVNAMVDGFAGKYMVLTVPTDVDFADCDSGQFRWGVNDQGGERYYQGPGQIDQWWILDVDGARLVINVTYLPAASAHDRAELQAIVDSIHIDSD